MSPPSSAYAYAGKAASDTACSSPLDTPLAKIMQQQHVVGGNAGAQPTPPLSASSHALAHSDAWRAYSGAYAQALPMGGAQFGEGDAPDYYYGGAVHYSQAPGDAPGAYVGEFGGVYAPDMAPAPAMHLPPIDGVARPAPYFVGASAPYSGPPAPYPPHGARAQPYPAPMVLGRFGLGMAPGAMPTPPPPQSAPALGHHVSASSMLVGSAPAALAAPTTPTRALGLARVSSHAQSSSSQRKRYLCNVCQKMFARPSTLSTHMHSHTGEKPFECTWDGCGKRFSVMSNLRRHQRIHERQRSKFADMQQQQHQQPDADSTSGSTTPLAAQMLGPDAHLLGSAAHLPHSAPHLPHSAPHSAPHLPPPDAAFAHAPDASFAHAPDAAFAPLPVLHASHSAGALDVHSPLVMGHHVMPHPHHHPQVPPLPSIAHDASISAA
ncbi:hypothetical protein LPJ70_005479, partial [Coemansia sp. RSA 2708]